MRGAAKRVKNKRQRGLKAAKNGGRLGQKVTCNIPIFGTLTVAARPIAKFLQVQL